MIKIELLMVGQQRKRQTNKQQNNNTINQPSKSMKCIVQQESTTMWKIIGLHYGRKREFECDSCNHCQGSEGNKPE